MNTTHLHQVWDKLADLNVKHGYPSIPPILRGNETNRFSIGDVVITGPTATRKEGLLYQITDVYEQNGYWSAAATSIDGRDNTTFRQMDIVKLRSLS